MQAHIYHKRSNKLMLLTPPSHTPTCHLTLSCWGNKLRCALTDQANLGRQHPILHKYFMSPSNNELKARDNTMWNIWPNVRLFGGPIFVAFYHSTEPSEGFIKFIFLTNRRLYDGGGVKIDSGIRSLSDKFNKMNVSSGEWRTLPIYILLIWI